MVTKYKLPPLSEIDPEVAAKSAAADREPDEPKGLDADFWDARPYLKHLRNAAHSRQRSAPAVLGVVLARVAACTDHRLRIPPIVGSDVGLSLFTAVLAPPGVGKSTATAIGTEVLPAPEGLDIADQLPIGTGEGLVEVFFGMVEETEEDTGKPKKVKKQVRHNAFFSIDEGQVLAELGTRRNAVLLPTIRSAFSGSTLGQMNASEERRRILPKGSYTIGMALALQTVLAGALLDDAEGGTPQRMLWLPAVDPEIPEDGPNWPGPLPWSPPTREALNALRDDGWLIGDAAHLDVAEVICRRIRAADLARARGQETTTLLEAHGELLQLKVAALLAVLDGRLNITEEDFQLAACIKASSDATRASVEDTVRRDAAKREEDASFRQARRAVRADIEVAENRIATCAMKVAQKVWADPDRRWTGREMQQAMRRWREEYSDAVDHAVAKGWITVETEPGQGDAKRLLRPGKVRAS